MFVHLNYNWRARKFPLLLSQPAKEIGLRKRMGPGLPQPVTNVSIAAGTVCKTICLLPSSRLSALLGLFAAAAAANVISQLAVGGKKGWCPKVIPTVASSGEKKNDKRHYPCLHL